MNRLELYSEFRELIGNPDPNDLTNRQIESYLVPALEWLAVQLNYSIHTNDTFPLVEGEREYQLPPDFGSMVLVEWNSMRLAPSSIYQWDREGFNYRNVPASMPREYAVWGRKLILGPPANLAAISTDPYLKIQYIGSTKGLDGSGTPFLGNLDQQLLLLRAATRYCRSHPTEENMARIVTYREEIAELLPAARKRAQNAIEDFYPHFHPNVDRFSPAR